jgi:hypothetical protein
MNITRRVEKVQRLERLKRVRANRDKNYAQAYNLAATMRNAGMDSEKAIASLILAHNLSTREAKRIWRDGPKNKRTRR